MAPARRGLADGARAHRGGPGRRRRLRRWLAGDARSRPHVPTFTSSCSRASSGSATCSGTTSAAFPNVEVVCARAEEHGREAGRDAYGTALARALAPPPVAVEWCLPLVRPGGRLVLYAGEPSRPRGRPPRRALGGGRPRRRAVPASRRTAPARLREGRADAGAVSATPGAARKRPLGLTSIGVDGRRHLSRLRTRRAASARRRRP